MFTRFSILDHIESLLEDLIPGWLPDSIREYIKLRFRLQVWGIALTPLFSIFYLIVFVSVASVKRYGFWTSFWAFIISFLVLLVLSSTLWTKMKKRGEKHRKARAKNASAAAKGFVVIPSFLSSYVKIIEFKTKDSTRRLRVPAELDGKPVWEIGADVFSNSPVLAAVDIDEGIQAIGAGAFQNCRELFLATIPSSVTQIGTDAFNGCEKLQELRLPEGLIKIEEYAFSGCFGLRCIVIPRSVSFIGTNAFPKTARLLVFPNSFAEAWAREAKYNYQRII